MAYIGNNPKWKTGGFREQSADPSTPQAGDTFNSNGTPRSSGLHIRKGSAWSRVGRIYTREMTVNGPYQDQGIQNNVLMVSLPDQIDRATLLEAKMTIFEEGSSGNTEIDIRYFRGGVDQGSIFTTKPIVTHSTSGTIPGPTNSGTLSVTAFQPGDIFILDIDQVPIGGAGFNVELFFDE